MVVNMSQVFDRAAEFISDNLGPLAPVALMALFVPVSILLNLGALAAPGGAGAIVGQAVSLVLALVTTWGGLAVAALAIEPGIGRRGAIDRATQRFLPAIAVSLAVLALVVVLTLPFGVIMALGGFDPTAAQGGGETTITPGAGLGFVAYFLVFVVVLLWLGARLALLTPIVIMERRGAGVFARALLLTRRLTWKIIGVTLLYGILFAVSFMAVRFGLGAVLRLAIGGDGPVTVASVLSAIFTSLVVTAFAVLKSAFVAKLYLAVRDAREAIVEAA